MWKTNIHALSSSSKLLCDAKLALLADRSTNAVAILAKAQVFTCHWSTSIDHGHQSHARARGPSQGGSGGFKIRRRIIVTIEIGKFFWIKDGGFEEDDDIGFFCSFSLAVLKYLVFPYGWVDFFELFVLTADFIKYFRWVLKSLDLGIKTKLLSCPKNLY